MTQLNISDFWTSGAFLRLPNGQIQVFEGPFESCGDEEADLGRQDFFGEREEWLKAASVQILSRSDFQTALESQLGSRSLRTSHFSEPQASGFETSFRMILGKIHRGEIEKAVPIVKSFSTGTLSVADRTHVIFHFLKLPSHLRVFGFWHAAKGILGATPEVLFELEGTTLRTMALAGSVPQGESSLRVPLLRDPKEMKEHQIVVEDLLQKLKPLGWLRQEPTVEVELPTLRHLLTRFEVTGVHKSARELIRQMHPTAALGVAPRGYGFQWLRELPDQKGRGFFGAPIFFRLSSQRSLCLVAIRSLFWDEHETQVFAGCGLVAASQLEREWNEVLAKMDSIHVLSGLSQ